MAAKHFRTDVPLTPSDDEDISIYRPLHDADASRPRPQPEVDPQAEVEPPRHSAPQAQPTGAGAAGAADPRASAGQGTGWYYGPAPDSQAWQPQPPVADAPAPRGGRPHRQRGPIVAVCVGAVCVAAVVAGLALCSSPLGRDTASQGNAAGQAEQQDATANVASDASANAGAADANANEGQDEATPKALSADALASQLSSLKHGREDCSIPTDGTEVDVKDGWVLVAYQSADDAQGTLSRMTASAAALAQSLSGTELSDSSTAQDGVSTVPAASTPAAIASSDASTPFAGVQVVALGEGRYVIGSVSLASADGLDAASESQILAAASSYAIEGPAYRYSGLASSGVAQSKGSAPTLLTGEKIVMRMTVPQPAQAQSSSSGSNTTGSGSASAGRSGSGSTSSSASRNTSAGTSGGGSSSYGSSGTSARRNTSYSGGGSGYSSGSGYGTGYSTSGSGASGYSAGSGRATGSSAQGTASATQGDAAE